MSSSLRTALNFVELPLFSKQFRELGGTDIDLRALQSALIRDPELGPVMAGTGGLRKTRLALSRSGGGKSGGLRIGYAYFPAYETVVLIAVFAKSEQANLSAREKAGIRKLIPELEADVAEAFRTGRATRSRKR